MKNLTVILPDSLLLDRYQRSIVAVDFDLGMTFQKKFYLFILVVKPGYLTPTSVGPAVFMRLTTEDHKLEMI